MKANPTYEKSLDFAVRIVNLCKYLKEHDEYIMSKQLLRSGTSTGANISESINAESNSDFIHKLLIALKESNETEYWITLLHRTDYLTDAQHDSILQDCQEMQKILTSIIVTSKKKNK